MASRPATDRLTRTALRAGIAVPFLYFGAQIAAAPFYPGYSFASQLASELGSEASRLPALFNAGIMGTGAATLMASVGFLRALRRLGTAPIASVVAWLSFLAAVSSGLACLWAGFFPLPDPRHNPGLLGVGTFLLPIVLLAALWKRGDARWLRAYLIADCLLLVPLAAGVIPGVAPGILQRIGAIVVYAPIAVVACFLIRKLPERAPQS